MNAHAEIAIAQLDLITQQTMVDAGLIVAVELLRRLPLVTLICIAAGKYRSTSQVQGCKPAP
jgi:hypothetical protein